MEYKICATSTLMLFVFCSTVKSLEQLECKKGSLEISTKNSEKPIMRINCNLKPLIISMNEMKKEQECQGINNLRIITSSDWRADAENHSLEFLGTTECVIVDGHSYNLRGSDYLTEMKRLQKYEHKKFGSFLYHFHITENGEVYEALGWDTIPNIGGGGLKCLHFAFIKPTRDVSPSASAIHAFNDLLKTAICLGKLSPNYRIIPDHYIFNNHHLSVNSFERKQLLKWDKCVQDTDLTKVDYDFGSFPIIFRELWGGKEPIETIYTRKDKIKFIMVGNYEARCFTTKNCIQILKMEQQSYNNDGKDLYSNYLIGDNGQAYEVFHWKQTWNKYWLKKEVMLIEFLGRFHSYLPSERAMKAFYSLLRLGEIWGYLSPDYKIVSYRQKENDSYYIGDMLHATVKKMERFTSEFP